MRRPALGVLFLVLATLAGRALRAQAPTADTALARIVGVVHDSSSGLPLAGAIVQLLPANDRTTARSVVADSLGRFAFDAVTPGTWLLGFLHARVDGIAGGAPTHVLAVRPGGGAREVALFLPNRPAATDALVADREAVGSVQGSVKDTAGAPVANARVLDDRGRELARSDASGGFALGARVASRHEFEVRAVGYEPVRMGVDVRPLETLVVDVELAALAPRMATVTTTARRTIAGFHERRGSGTGQYLDANDIARRKPTAVAEALRGFQGVAITPRTSFSSRVIVRAERWCEPTVFIDGVELMSRTQDLDAFVDVDDIEALEVYIKASEVPLDFPGDPYCGAILIWRKADHRRR